MAQRPVATGGYRGLLTRVLLVTHYFPPEIGAPQARLASLARYWVAAGERVTVLTGVPNHPTGVVPPEWKGRLRSEEKVDGYRVVRAWLFATPNQGLLKKTLGHLSFMVSSVVLGSRPSGPADVVVVSSPTFFSVFSALLLARRRRCPFILEVRDLWPAIFVELGVLTNRQLIRLLERLELAAYQAADAVVVVTEGFKDNLVGRGVPADKVHTIPNGADLDRFSPSTESDGEARASMGAEPDDVLVLYVGAHGISHGLISVARAAAALSGTHVHFAFVGEGAAKNELAATVSSLGLDNTRLLPGMPSEEIPRILAAADICLVPLRDVPLFDTFIPSKIFEYFAAGKAVIGSVRGEAARILEAGGALVVPPEDPAALAEAVRVLAADPERRRAMGTQARRFVEEHFDRRSQAERYRRLLHDVAQESSS